MRKAGGKSKGGNYERIVITKLQKAFSSLGIEEDDIFRTKNSGSTKKQPGDIQFSPKMAKLFPVLVECKHYKTVLIKLGKHIHQQPKSYCLRKWWVQVGKEQKQRQDKKGILVFRQNSCPDIVCLQVQHLQDLCGENNWKPFSWSMFVMYKDQTLVMLPLKEFLQCVVLKLGAEKAARLNTQVRKRIIAPEGKK